MAGGNEDFVAAVRRRPGLYLGDTGGLGLGHIVSYALDVLCGHAPMVGASVFVRMNGRQVRIDSTRVPGEVELLRQALDDPNSTIRRESNAPWELAAAMAVCSRFVFETTFGQERVRWECSGGVPARVTPQETSASACLVELTPDDGLFEPPAQADPNWVIKRARELAAVLPGIRIEIVDQQSGRTGAFCYPHGMSDLVSETAGTGRHPNWSSRIQLEAVTVDAALHLGAMFSRRPDWISFANTVPTLRGGSHLRGFETAFRNACGSSLESLRDLATGAISIRAPREKLVFDGPIKDLLRVEWLERRIAESFEAPIRDHLKQHGWIS